MDELAELLASLNLLNCSASEMPGFGFAGCKRDKNRVVTIELTRAGFAYQGKSKAYIRQEQLKGNIIILQGVVSFEPEDHKPTYDVRPGSGLNRLAGEVPGLTKVMFDNGIDFANALRSLLSFGAWNLAVYDVDGAKFLIQTKSGTVKGISIGQIYPYTYKGGDGTKAPVTSMEFQILDVTEESRQVRIDASELDFTPTELTDVNDITLNVRPTAAGTKVLFNPLLSDKSHQVPNLTVAKLKYKVNGTTVVPSGISYSSDAPYVALTVAALSVNDVITLQTNNATTGLNAIEIDDILYKSAKETVTVTA